MINYIYCPIFNIKTLPAKTPVPSITSLPEALHTRQFVQVIQLQLPWAQKLLASNLFWFCYKQIQAFHL